MGAEMDGVGSFTASLDELQENWTGSYEYRTRTGDEEYYIVMEYGSRPHAITPDTAPALHFWVDGVEVYTDFVNHPGTEPQPYMRPGAEAAARNIRPIVAQEDDLEGVTRELAEWVRRVAKRLAPEETGQLKASIVVIQVS